MGSKGRDAREKDERRYSPHTCETHDELKVMVWRCEVPANMNGAPRVVCPDCLEERAEHAEAQIRRWEEESAALPEDCSIGEYVKAAAKREMVLREELADALEVLGQEGRERLDEFRHKKG